MDKIAKNIIGLKTRMENITDEKITKFVQFTESHDEPGVHIWFFIIAVFLLLINIVGKQLKNDYIEEYQFRKIIESFFVMKSIVPKEFDINDLRSQTD